MADGKYERVVLADGSEWLWQRVIDGVWRGESGDARAVIMAQASGDGFEARWNVASIFCTEGDGKEVGESLDDSIRAAKWHAMKWSSYQQALRWIRQERE